MKTAQWPNVSEKRGVWCLNWSTCNLTMTVRPDGDECATISVSGKGGAEVWMLGAVFNRLGAWAGGDGAFIDDALRDDKVGDQVYADPHDTLVTWTKVRGGVRFTVEDIADGIEFNFDLRKRDSGLAVAVIADSISPTPAGFAVLRDVLQRTYINSQPVLGHFPGDLGHLRDVARWAADRWHGGGR